MAQLASCDPERRSPSNGPDRPAHWCGGKSSWGRGDQPPGCRFRRVETINGTKALPSDGKGPHPQASQAWEIELAKLMLTARRAARSLRWGSLRNITLETGKLTFLARMINADYFLLLVMEKEGNMGAPALSCAGSAPPSRKACNPVPLPCGAARITARGAGTAGSSRGGICRQRWVRRVHSLTGGQFA